MPKDKTLEKIVTLTKDNDAIQAVWLYGSRARGLASDNSDYDLAILFKEHINEPLTNRIRVEELSNNLSSQVDQEVNLIDISMAPLPLAMTVVTDNYLLLDKSAWLRMRCEQSIMSKWELDYQYNKVRYA
ncbi:nucleotidyltransferase domain-containing protein [Psychrosphaera aquimarina]|uniref:Nucleotidyltransferase domain-containing protein n=1 Tax=Psychrosphaera aquimarina TaxID=2044854 RepID=A0ABU3R4F4_9GAMM|nr:nucleotidyltransferase domain-containing protein [Psychrosphaera aquimarina]MDU0114555.1 nucleotidyltransferase domain-containing protein [Psychrosphaera aquimarina]